MTVSLGLEPPVALRLSMEPRVVRRASLHSYPECFLCGTCLDPKNRCPASSTVEHVIPKWLIAKAGINRQGFRFLGTKDCSLYPALGVPACARCNAELLGRLEQKIDQATGDQDKYPLHNVSASHLSIWMMKILFELMWLDGEVSQLPLAPAVTRLGAHLLHRAIALEKKVGEVCQFDLRGDLDQAKDFDLIVFRNPALIALKLGRSFAVAHYPQPEEPRVSLQSLAPVSQAQNYDSILDMLFAHAAKLTPAWRCLGYHNAKRRRILSQLEKTDCFRLAV